MLPTVATLRKRANLLINQFHCLKIQWISLAISLTPRDISSVSKIFIMCLALLVFSIYVIFEVSSVSLDWKSWKILGHWKQDPIILHSSTFVCSSLLLKVLVLISFLYVELSFDFLITIPGIGKYQEFPQIGWSCRSWAKIGAILLWSSMFKYI